MEGMRFLEICIVFCWFYLTIDRWNYSQKAVVSQDMKEIFSVIFIVFVQVRICWVLRLVVRFGFKCEQFSMCVNGKGEFFWIFFKGLMLILKQNLILIFKCSILLYIFIERLLSICVLICFYVGYDLKEFFSTYFVCQVFLI